MNVIWSKHVQGTKSLYYSRKLRFNDLFCKQYMELFNLDEKRSLKILEIGCGPGAFAQSLCRWYPNAEIIGVDRDSEFIDFATKNVKGVKFLEGDITALPFDDNTFDVTISNTVAEHIEPSKFYSEQFRVLKPGGTCLVLSTRKGININPSCITDNDYEKQFWQKAELYDDAMDRFLVCKYPMNELEMPLSMAKYGFNNISTGFVTIDLTPDNPKYSTSFALDMINANRQTTLDAIDSVLHTIPEHVTMHEIEEMKRLTDEKYNIRIKQYENGEKQWDTNVSIIMVIKGMKSTSKF